MIEKLCNVKRYSLQTEGERDIPDCSMTKRPVSRHEVFEDLSEEQKAEKPWSG